MYSPLCLMPKWSKSDGLWWVSQWVLKGDQLGLAKPTEPILCEHYHAFGLKLPRPRPFGLELLRARAFAPASTALCRPHVKVTCSMRFSPKLSQMRLNLAALALLPLYHANIPCVLASNAKAQGVFDRFIWSNCFNICNS